MAADYQRHLSGHQSHWCNQRSAFLVATYFGRPVGRDRVPLPPQSGTGSAYADDAFDRVLYGGGNVEGYICSHDPPLSELGMGARKRHNWSASGNISLVEPTNRRCVVAGHSCRDTACQ